MTTVTTTYVGATNTRGSRIVAKAAGRQSSAPYNHALSAYENHREVAGALAKVLGLTGELTPVPAPRLKRGWRFAL